MFLHSPIAQIAISITVTTANIIILAKAHGMRKMHRIMKYLIVHLALADLLFGITYGARTAVLVLEPGARTACVMLLAPAVTFGGSSLTAMLAFYGYTAHCVVHFHLAAARNTGKGGGGRYQSHSTRVTLIALACWIPWLIVGCVALVILRSSSPSASYISYYQQQQPMPPQPSLPVSNQSDSSVTWQPQQQYVSVSLPSLCRITNKEYNQDFVLFVSIVFLAHVLLVLVLQLICIAALRRRLADARKMAAAALALISKKSSASLTGMVALEIVAACDEGSVEGGGGGGERCAVSQPSLQHGRYSKTSLVDITAKQQRTRTSVVSVTSNGTICNNKPRKASLTPAVRYLRNSTVAFRIIVAVTVIFSLCWLPFIVCMLLHVICPPYGGGRCGLTANVTFTFGALIVARGALNVFVYSVGCREFRLSCRSSSGLLRSLSVRRLHQHPAPLTAPLPLHLTTSHSVSARRTTHTGPVAAISVEAQA